MLADGRNTATRQVNYLVRPVKADAVIYPGAQVALQGGYAIPGTEATDLIAAGRSEEYVDNTGGADGAVTVKVARGCFLWENSATDPVDETHVLGTCYIEDDETVSATDNTGARSAAGTVIGFENGCVWVQV